MHRLLMFTCTLQLPGVKDWMATPLAEVVAVKVPIPKYEGGYYLPMFNHRKLPTEKLDYFLVLDFEANSNEGQGCPNVIEFPVLKLNVLTLETESIFHSYVQPIIHPKLSTFIKELTGITQEMVDGQPTLPRVLDNLSSWMKKEGLLDKGTHSCFVTCGDCTGT